MVGIEMFVQKLLVSLACNRLIRVPLPHVPTESKRRVLMTITSHCGVHTYSTKPSDEKDVIQPNGARCGPLVVLAAMNAYYAHLKPGNRGSTTAHSATLARCERLE